jgi:hypothetical protein
MGKRTILDVTTPLGYRVVLTRNRWREIVRFKHPAAARHEDKIHKCLGEPDIIRASAKDPNVHLYYLRIAEHYLCVVCAPATRDHYFVVTVYLTKRLKQGDDLWTK